MDDSKIIRLLHKDPNAGMEYLMDRYTGLVYSIVKGRLEGSYFLSSDIEDCVADVFSKFYFELSNFDIERSSVKAYLCVLARNHSIDVAKKRSRQMADVAIDDPDLNLQIADEITVEDQIEEKELRGEVIRSIEELGPPDSEIIFRKFYYLQSSRFIAEKLGLTVSNVDTRAHRALNKLRKLFGGEGYEKKA